MSKGQIILTLLIVSAAASWVNYADHPTARNLRTAIIDSLRLL